MTGARHAGSLHLRAITGLLAVIHLTCALLDLDNRAGWSLRPYPSMLGLVADNPAWTWLHGLCAFLIAAALTLRVCRSHVLGFSAAVLLVWGAALFAWGTQLDHPPVSLLGPTLALGFAAAAAIAAHAWASQE